MVNITKSLKKIITMKKVASWLLNILAIEVNLEGEDVAVTDFT